MGGKYLVIPESPEFFYISEFLFENHSFSGLLKCCVDACPQEWLRWKKDNTMGHWGCGASGTLRHFWWNVSIGTTTLEKCLAASAEAAHTHTLKTYQKCGYTRSLRMYVYIYKNVYNGGMYV